MSRTFPLYAAASLFYGLIACSNPALAAAFQSSDLSGNWAVKEPLPDGTLRRTYLDIRQQGSNITGHIRTGQFYFQIAGSSTEGDTTVLNATMQDGATTRNARFEVKLAGDTLHVATRRRPDAPPIQMEAHRVPDGEGAMPARLPLPPLGKVSSNGLATTPPMGWNSWNKFAGRVDDAGVRAAADAIASNGMREAGYLYVNIDDTWQGDRDGNGNIRSNKKFPDMAALAAYVHSKGLKIGIYSSPGPNTCAGYEGSYGHEEQDARTYASWGIDYLKYDWCGARNIYRDDEMQAVYQKMGMALRQVSRPIVYSLCQYGRADVWKWGPDVGGNLWRTTGDISDHWDSMAKIGFGQSDLAPFAAPGHWNDPDMLEIGNGGMSEDEYRTHMTLWSILAAPMLAGNDLSHMDPRIFAILTNRAVIAIDQDQAGKQGARKQIDGGTEIWVRELAGGDRAVAIFNRGTGPATVDVRWANLGWSQPPAKAQDVWASKPVQLGNPDYTTGVSPHGVVLLRVPAP